MNADAFDLTGSVVLYRTAPAEVERALRQFLAIPLRVKLWVIDNSPQPMTLPFEDPRIVYRHGHGNVGYGRGHNLALRAASNAGRYHVVMNTDIDYLPAVMLRLVAFLDEFTDVGLAAPRINYEDGSLQHVCRLLPTPANLFLRRFLPNAEWTRRADALYELRWWDHAAPANLPYLQGSFMMLRAKLALELGGFDERFFMYGEDIDLTRRLHAVSRTMYLPDVAITHEYRRFSSKSFRGTWIGIQNNLRYFNKWGWFFDRERARINRATVAQLERLQR